MRGSFSDVSAVTEFLDQGDHRRPLVITGASHRHDGWLAPALIGREPLRFRGAIQHVPRVVVDRAKQLLENADAIVTVDPGTPCPYFAAFYECNLTGRHMVANRAHGALGYALPAALGAAFARPGAKCVAVMGDGAFGFVAGELETVARLGLPVTLVVISNATFGWIKAGQKANFQGRYFSVDFDVTDHAAVAAAYGVKSWRVSEPGELRRTLAEAAGHDGPTLVDVVCQPLHEANAPVSEWIA